MTEKQIKQFPTSADEYFHKQLKDGVPWKTEIYQFFEVINFYRKATKELQEENERLKKKLEEFRPNRCKNGYYISKNGRPIPCYIYHDCNNCPFFKE